MAKSRTSEQNSSLQSPIDAYEYSYKTRNLEIRLFWQRSNYFLILNTAVATGIILQGLKPNALSLLLAGLGACVSILWYGVNLGSKFWQTRWEHKLAQLERQISPQIHLFNTSYEETTREVAMDLTSQQDRSAFRRTIDAGIVTKPSVSRNMILLSLLFATFYTAVIIYSVITLLKCKVV